MIGNSVEGNVAETALEKIDDGGFPDWDGCHGDGELARRLAVKATHAEVCSLF